MSVVWGILMAGASGSSFFEGRQVVMEGNAPAGPHALKAAGSTRKALKPAVGCWLPVHLRSGRGPDGLPRRSPVEASPNLDGRSDAGTGSHSHIRNKPAHLHRQWYPATL